MMRRACMIGAMMAGLAFTIHTIPSYCRLASSARAVRQYLHTFDRSGKELSPVERLAFSLLLAKSDKDGSKL
ncbi:MAG TPA: hypothetical protein VKB88_34560 [Bryobacteraceae bacterium]|nr:hypothetical protein [Bryobacteraceae bacterium]